MNHFPDYLEMEILSILKIQDLKSMLKTIQIRINPNTADDSKDEEIQVPVTLSYLPTHIHPPKYVKFHTGENKIDR